MCRVKPRCSAAFFILTDARPTVDGITEDVVITTRFVSTSSNNFYVLPNLQLYMFVLCMLTMTIQKCRISYSVQLPMHSDELPY